MLPIAYYLLKVIICSGILFGYYWLLLRNKVFHKYNRFYLMASVVLSLLLPLIKINFWQTQQPVGVIKVLQVVSYGDEYMDNVIISTQNNSFDAAQLYPFAYLLISLILLAVFFHTLYVIVRLLKRYPRQTIDKISFINTDAKSTPFSFLNYIFWNHNIDMETITGNQIFKHELAHVQEGHTYDKLFINIILIFFWCNPFYWLYRKELNMIHEFIADKKAVEDSDTEAFAAMILQATYPQHRFQLTNNFFYSPIKRRLLMLNKNKNPKVNYFGRVMVLPLAILVFAAFTFKAKPNNHFYNGKKITVVIDAGHGGMDGGAKASDGSFEKEITLAIAKEIKALNHNSAIEIVLTKESDKYLTKEQITEFTKNQNATIFIALHTGATTPSGLSVWLPNNGYPFSLQSKLLGESVVSEFVANYNLPVSPLLAQRHLYNLENNACPSIFLEAGVLSNSKDLSYLQSAKGKETIAQNILNGIEKYAIAKLQNNLDLPLAQVDSPPNNTGNFYVNGKYSDSNYLKTPEFQSKALCIVDGKEIGNVGINYVKKLGTYSSVTVYNPENAKKEFGEKGKYGVIKLTQKDLAMVTADSVHFDENKNTIKINGNVNLSGNLDNTVIYIDGKISTAQDLNKIAPSAISSVNVIKGERLNEVMETRGKDAIIEVSLKPADLAAVTVENRIKINGKINVTPLYVVDNKIEESDFNLKTIAPNDIERIDVLKDEAAIEKYGDKAKDGVIEITTKTKVLTNITIKEVPKEVVVAGKQIQPSYSVKPNNSGVVEVRGYSIDSNKKTDSVKLQVTDRVFTKTEVEPSYPGGPEAWKTYLKKNLNANIPTDEGWKPGIYTVILRFIVHTDGSISDVTAMNYEGSKTAQHCIDLIKKSPKWIPAVQNGRAVDAYRKQPITFLIEEADVKKPITR